MHLIQFNIINIDKDGKITKFGRVAIDPTSIEGIMEPCDKYDEVIPNSTLIRFRTGQGVQVEGKFEEVLEKLLLKEF